MEKINLNDLVGEDYSIKVPNPHIDSIEVVFKNLESEIVKLIYQFRRGAIFGCVAWLTSKRILTALSACKNVQIIVQKEDFLRPDINSGQGWKTEIRKMYQKISCDMTRYEFRNPICSLSVCCDPSVDGIRCVGNHNKSKAVAFPRSHHKFLVFCDTTDSQHHGETYTRYKPVKVWTGSFNLTENATYSFENAIVISDVSGENPIINSYLKEHHQIFCLSEQLDWVSDWSEPEYRIGT